MMLNRMIDSVEKQMKGKLKEVRETFAQSGDKGTAVESVFRAFLREYLPKRLSIGHGEVIDTTQNRSGQTDVVIANEDHPFTFSQDLPGLFFIEGVCGAGEVKTTLTSTELAKTLKNSVTFKRLRVTHSKNSLISANPSDRDRFYSSPPWFLVAFDSQLKLSTIKNAIQDYERRESIKDYRLVDAVFVLSRGWVINFGDGQSSFKYIDSTNESLEGWNVNESDSVMFELLAWLSVVMPNELRFEPILPRYMLPAPDANFR